MGLFNRFKNYLGKVGRSSKSAGQAAINSYAGSNYTPNYTAQSRKQQERANYERMYADSMSNNSYQTTRPITSTNKRKPTTSSASRAPKPKPKPTPKPAPKPKPAPRPVARPTAPKPVASSASRAPKPASTATAEKTRAQREAKERAEREKAQKERRRIEEARKRRIEEEYQRKRKAEFADINRQKAEFDRQRAKFDIPDRLGLQAFNPNLDALGVYNPDFDALNQSQQAILDSFNQQRGVFQKQADTTRQDLANRFRQLQEEQQMAKRDSQRNFADTRRSIQDEVFDASRRDQAAASARGMGDSGAAQLGNIQRRMAEGEALSGMAQDYYDTEEGILKAMQATKENQDIAEQEVSNSLAEAMSGILGMETQQKSQYTSQMEALKRQVQEDTNALTNVKNQWGQTAVEQQNAIKQAEASWASQRDQALQAEMQAEREYQHLRDKFMYDQSVTSANWEQKLKEFQEAQYQADRGYNLNIDQFNNQKSQQEKAWQQQQAEFNFRKQQAAQQAAQAQAAQAQAQSRWQQEFGLKQKQFGASQAAAQQAAQDEALKAYDIYDKVMTDNMSEAQFNTFMDSYGEGSGATWEGAQEYAGLAKDDKKKKGLFNWFKNVGK